MSVPPSCAMCPWTRCFMFIVASPKASPQVTQPFLPSTAHFFSAANCEISEICESESAQNLLHGCQQISVGIMPILKMCIHACIYACMYVCLCVCVSVMLHPSHFIDSYRFYMNMCRLCMLTYVCYVCYVSLCVCGRDSAASAASFAPQRFLWQRQCRPS